MQSDPIKLNLPHARRFLLACQQLNPPRSLSTESGMADLFRSLECIQFDPLNLVGRNPDLFLQVRINGYRPEMLAVALHDQHLLVEGFDKMWSIFPAADWPFFERRRKRVLENHLNNGSPESVHAWQLVKQMRSSSKDSSHLPKTGESILWDWGKPVSLDRAALDLLNKAGIVTIISREGNRKTYDLVERVLPAAILAAPDPHLTLADYHDWHVLRRIGGLGLAQTLSSDYWLGIFGMKAHERRSALDRLQKAGMARAVEVESLGGMQFLLRASDEHLLEETARPRKSTPRVSFLPPLDNLLWDRKLIQAIFGFDYLWEIYKKPAQRVYGSYTMPVLYGEAFIARCELKFDRAEKILSVPSWWWEPEVAPNAGMTRAISTALTGFARYLGAERIDADIPGIKISF